MPISKPHSSMASKNTGSSSNLVDYLDKENQELEKMALSTPDREKEIAIRNRQQHFFNAESDSIRGYEVKEKIDSNISKLGKKDAKFFAPTINFSKEELNHLASNATNGRNVKNVMEMNRMEFERYNEEHSRKYKGTDKAVVERKAKSGDMKEGLQSHVHIIVSRKDKTQKMKLSPLSNEKSKTRTIGRNSYKVGFDRKAWIINNEKTFDELFKYRRKERERFWLVCHGDCFNFLSNGICDLYGAGHQSWFRNLLYCQPYFIIYPSL